MVANATKSNANTSQTAKDLQSSKSAVNGADNAASQKSQGAISFTKTQIAQKCQWYAQRNYHTDFIKEFQRVVNTVDDGSVGKNTIHKVAEWQKSKKLEADGLFGNSSASAAGLKIKYNSASAKPAAPAKGGGNTSAKQIELFGRTLTRTKSGDPESWVQKFMGMTTVGFYNAKGEKESKKLYVHKKLAGNFTAIFDDIMKDAPNFRIDKGSLGTYCYRYVNNGSKSPTLSYHSYGVAVDINPGVNPFDKKAGGNDDNKRLRSSNHPVVKAFAKHGFGWGGRYSDYMHFSYFNGS